VATDSDEQGPGLIRTLDGLGHRAAAVRAAVVPDWLAEVVRPKPAPVPWPQMIRAALAICVPLAVALALGNVALGVLPATGGLLGVLADTGGTYLARVKRVCSAAVFGGAAGLVIGAVTHGHGWLPGRRHAQAGHRGGAGAARGVRHRAAADRGRVARGGR